MNTGPKRQNLSPYQIFIQKNITIKKQTLKTSKRKLAASSSFYFRSTLRIPTIILT